MKKNKDTLNFFLILVLILYVTSLALPSVTIVEPFFGNKYLNGLEVLLFGWIGFTGFCPAWLANLTFF